MVLEWQRASSRPAGEVQPLLLNPVDHGIIRILDIAILIKDPDGSVSGVELGEFKQVTAALRRSGGQLAASGRIPVQAVLAALDAVEATD